MENDKKSEHFETSFILCHFRMILAFWFHPKSALQAFTLAFLLLFCSCWDRLGPCSTNFITLTRKEISVTDCRGCSKFIKHSWSLVLWISRSEGENIFAALNPVDSLLESDCFTVWSYLVYSVKSRWAAISLIDSRWRFAAHTLAC